jgi:hypothetical protein
MTSTHFMYAIYRGPKQEAQACRAALDRLGDDDAGDTLRNLLAEIVTAYRRPRGEPWPTWPLVTDATGKPLTLGQIAAAIDWPPDLIEADLRKLADVGLIRITE